MGVFLLVGRDAVRGRLGEASLVRPWAHINSKVEVLAMRTCDRVKPKVTALAKGKVESNRR